MSRLRVYIKPFLPDGSYGTYQEVTEDIVTNSLSKIKRQLDGSEYDVGVFKFDSFSLGLRNEHGKYSEPENLQSIFAYKRSDSLVKVTWDINDDILECGVVRCGYAILGEETTIFEGLLNDEALVQDIDDQVVKFKVLSFTALFDRVEMPSVSNGQSCETILYNCLNQSAITDLLTVSSGNISASYNATVDDVSDFDDNTVNETVKVLLELSNSILYIEDLTIYVSDRTESATTQKTFYGQSSLDGAEDVQDIKNIRTGLNRTFNLVKWEDSIYTSRDETSITTYGVRKKEISFDSITNNTTKQAIIDNIKNEFYTPKKELELSTPLNYTTLALGMLDKINIDYPSVLVPATGSTLPQYGAAQYGVDEYPIKLWDLTLSTTEYFKIMGYTYDLKKEIITYKLREI